MALLTAGVGIMNIMLVSVTERTREIGIRKSIGAPRSSILRQFLFESLFLSIAGGIIGIMVGVGAGNIVALKFNLPPIFPWLWITVSMVVCSTIGMTFGLFPAWKAANLNPVEALRPKLSSGVGDCFISLKGIAEHRRKRIVLLEGFACFCLGGNGITVKAAVRASVVAADIATLDASTGMSLSAVFFSAAHLSTCNTPYKFTVDTPTMHDAVL